MTSPLTVTDTDPTGRTSTTMLGSGEVIPLVPDSLDHKPLTPDKAVTFDLREGGVSVWIYPQRNEAYVGNPPWRAGRTPADLPAALRERYGLKQTGDGVALDLEEPGVWRYHVGSGRTRTISWHAGQAEVTVTDRDANGKMLGSERVSVGRRVNGG